MAKENYIAAMSTSLTAAKTSPTIKDTIPATPQYCFTTQNTFGWHLLTAGLLIQQWSQHQQIHNNNNSQLPQTHLAGDIWNKKISTALIHQAHRLWSIAQLQRFYQNADLLDPTVRQAIFSIPMEEHIKKGGKHITQWIQRNAKTVKKLKQMRKKQLSTGQSTITRFFSHTTQNIPTDLPIAPPARSHNRPSAQRNYIHPPIPIDGPRQNTIGQYFIPVTNNSAQSTANHHNPGQTTTTTAPKTPHNTLHTPELHSTQNRNNNKTQPQSALTALEKGR